MAKKEENSVLVKKKQIKEAVQVLKEYLKKWDEENPSRKQPLLEEPGQTPILLNFTLKKIPELSKIQMIKVPLPHTLVTDVSEVCLFTGDLDKKDRKADIEPTVQHYKELLSKHGVECVSEVIPLRQLRTEYRQHEAKRNLYGAYDYFLADNKICQCLPRVLGKFFFKKRKFPQQINLATSNVKYQIENALSRAVFFFTGQGNSCCTEVAHLGLSSKQIIENVETAVNTLADNIPGTWKNIKGLYIKTARSISIPIYLSSESANDVELPPPETVEDVEAEELTTLKGYKVKVYNDGTVELIKTEDSSDSESDLDSDEALSKKTNYSPNESKNKRKKIRKKGKIQSNVSDDSEEDIETGKILKKKKIQIDEEDQAETSLKRSKRKGKIQSNVSEEEAEDGKIEKILKKKKIQIDKEDKAEISLKKSKRKGKIQSNVSDEEEKGVETEKILKKKKIQNNEEDKAETSSKKSKRTMKLKKVSAEKGKSVLKQKKENHMDEVYDNETKAVLTKKKKKVSK